MKSKPGMTWLLAVGTTFLVLVPQFAVAQGGVDLDFNVVDVEVEEANGEQVENFVAEVNVQNIDQWVFRNQTMVQARTMAQTSLQVQVDFVNLAGPLTEIQRLKLMLAGQGDINRFFEDYEILRASLPKGRVAQNDWQQMWQKIQPIQLRQQAGLHGPGSLFQRTVKALLTSDQKSKYEVLDKERRAKHYQATIRVALTTIETKVPLTVAQRKRLVELLTTKTKPPERVLAQYGDFYYVMSQLAGLPDEDLKPIFEAREWKPFSTMVMPYKNNQIMRQFEAVEAVE